MDGDEGVEGAAADALLGPCGVLVAAGRFWDGADAPLGAAALVDLVAAFEGEDEDEVEDEAWLVPPGRIPEGRAPSRVGMCAADRAAPVAIRPPWEPRRAPMPSAATAPAKLNSPKIANGAKATSTSPTMSGQDWGFQIVFTEASPLMMRVMNPIVSGPVRSSTTTADT